MDAIFIFKIIHFVFMISWFAGMFYLVRLFVYHTEAFDYEQPRQDILRAQYHTMETRLYKIICNPAMIITWIAGIAMIHLYGMEWFKANMWLHHKLIFLVLLSGYLGYCKKIIKKLKTGKTGFSSFQFRLFNEVPTILMIVIVSIAVFKNRTNPIYLLASIVGFAIVLFLLARLYKRYRTS